MAKTGTGRFGVLGAALLAFGIAGCQQTGAGTAAAERIHPAYDATGRLTRLAYDSHGDGKIDTWGYMDGTHVVRIEIDEDGDGKVDVWEYYSPGSQGSVGPQTLERIERSTRHDGTVSRWDYFDNGLLTRVEEDTDGDGKVDKWQTYSGGTLSMIAIDSERRGKPDRRLIYRSDGTVDRIETDPTGSGQFQGFAPPRTK